MPSLFSSSEEEVDPELVATPAPIDEDEIDEPIVDDKEPLVTPPDHGFLVRVCPGLAGLRDFVFQAFSDGYQSTYCCGDDSLFCGVLPGRSKIAPADMYPEIQTSRSGSSYPSVGQSSSYDSKRRRKHKSVSAYGFAEDMDGRPVVITRTINANQSKNRVRAQPPLSVGGSG